MAVTLTLKPATLLLLSYKGKAMSIVQSNGHSQSLIDESQSSYVQLIVELIAAIAFGNESTDKYL